MPSLMEMPRKKPKNRTVQKRRGVFSQSVCAFFSFTNYRPLVKLTFRNARTDRGKCEAILDVWLNYILVAKILVSVILTRSSLLVFNLGDIFLCPHFSKWEMGVC